jgi:preprotein translocase subunit SecE
MAVAVKSMPENTTKPESGSLVGSSILGAAYVFAAIAVLTVGVPKLWFAGVSPWIRPALGSFIDVAGLIVVEIFVLGVLALFGTTLAGGGARTGLKAGVFSVVAGLLGIAIVGSIFAGGGTFAEVFGLSLMGEAAFFGVRFMLGSGFEPGMKTFEGQGWFSTETYKPAQGRLVRRCTLIGIVGIVACGIWTMLNHHTFDAMGKDWILKLPLVGSVATLLPDVRITLPIIIAGGAFWLAWRVVNMPTFAEFLIATEGELNKIAWPTRKNLLQDTIVVLTTVVVMTLFLFLVDVAWGKILSHPYVGVLKLDSGTQQKEAPDVKDLDW